MQKDWSLTQTGLDRPEPQQSKEFPRIYDLIDIAIFEKKPDQVLRWYDQRPKDRFGLYGVGEDAIAIAVQAHAPDRAVDIWKALAERLIARVKPKAYQEAARYLRKAANVMDKQKRQAEWERYLLELRENHSRKRRLMEILDTLNSQPILKVRK
jgi:uncharacterized Zn finger protein